MKLQLELAVSEHTYIEATEETEAQYVVLVQIQPLVLNEQEYKELLSASKENKIECSVLTKNKQKQ